MTPKQTPPSIHVSLCQSVICRRGEKRQDLQCSRVAGHGDPGSVDPIERHLHQIALGWCLAPWTEMAGQDGRTGGHDQRLHGRVLVGRSASDMLRALRLQADRQARPAQYQQLVESVQADSPSLMGDDLDAVVRAREAILQPEPAPAMVDAEGQPTLASLQMLNRPRYQHLVELAQWLRAGAYPASYTFEQALTEHLQRGIITVEDARFLRLIEADHNRADR